MPGWSSPAPGKLRAVWICSSTRSSISETDRAPPGEHLVGDLDRIHVQAGAPDRGPRVNPQFERGDHTEEARSRAAGCPIHVWVVFGVAVDLLTVGGDDFQSKHALACRPEHRTVPAVSALQKIAAEANAFAMAGGKEQSLCVQFCREDAGDLARADVCDHPIRFDSAVIEAADVEQQAAVAQVTGRPAVPARTYADLISVGPRIADRRDHVVGVVRLHDYIGKALRQKAIPHRCPTGRFVAVCATEEGLCGGK